MNEKIRILIVNAAAQGRDFLSRALSRYQDMELLGTAPTGSLGIIKAREVKPDVILLDAELKDYDCARFTDEVLGFLDECGIIISMRKDAKELKLVETIRALENGAFDIYEIPENAYKPDYDLMDNGSDRKLVTRIRAYSIKRYTRRVHSLAGKPAADKGTEKPADVLLHEKHKALSTYKILVMGVSTGGPRALAQLLPQLPADFPMPVVIVIHLPRLFTASLAQELAKRAQVHVGEAREGDVLQPGTVYIAQGGKHLTISGNESGSACIRYNDDPPQNNCKPSVDILFASVCTLFQDKTIAVLLTGMGEDGAQGLKKLRDTGARTLVQDKETSVVWGMPGAAVNLGAAEEILPLEKIILRVMEII